MAAIGSTVRSQAYFIFIPFFEDGKMSKEIIENEGRRLRWRKTRKKFHAGITNPGCSYPFTIWPSSSGVTANTTAVYDSPENFSDVGWAGREKIRVGHLN